MPLITCGCACASKSASKTDSICATSSSLNQPTTASSVKSSKAVKPSESGSGVKDFVPYVLAVKSSVCLCSCPVCYNNTTVLCAF